MATLFHRANYPNDVDATVAYVAPVMLGPIDPRFETFMSSIGDEPKRERIKQFQRTCLERRSELFPMLEEMAMKQNMSFAPPLDEVFERAVIEFPFSYWAGDLRVSDTLQSDAPKEQLFELLSSVFTRLTEHEITYNAALYYQQFTELGYHSYPVAHIRDLLQRVKDPDFSIYVPENARDAAFRQDVMPTILNYLQSEGNNILYLYGEYDIWTSCAVELTGQTNAVRLIAKNKGHVFNIVDLALPEKEQVYTALEDWLAVEIRR